MENKFFLQGKKYKFFLWFHIIFSCLYLVSALIMFWYYGIFTTYSYKSIYESIIFNKQAEISRNEGFSALFSLTVNIILMLIIKKRFKYTKEILNFYSIVVLTFCIINLIKGGILDVQNKEFNPFRLLGGVSFIIMGFYFYYLNIDKFRNKKEGPDNIDFIGTHND